MTQKSLLVKITGKVQGVSFRYFTQKQATKLNLSGWVRNCPDGSVEALISGTEEAVMLMIDWFYQGSPYAVVASVKSEPADLPSTIGQFRITY